TRRRARRPASRSSTGPGCVDAVNAGREPSRRGNSRRRHALRSRRAPQPHSCLNGRARGTRRVRATKEGATLSEAQAQSSVQYGGREAAVGGIDRNEDAVVVSLAGELDLYNAEQVRSALLDACSTEPDVLVVDLEEVRFIDSTALGVLIEARSRMAD